MNNAQIELLESLLRIASPSGDEWRMTQWLMRWLSVHAAEAEVTRLRDCLVATKGESPQVAIFAHIDTCGFTVGYGTPPELIPIGGPVFAEGQSVQVANRNAGVVGTLARISDGMWSVQGLSCLPGDRLVYAAAPAITAALVQSPYLDNRAGIWAALQALQACARICVCFTTGEETGASGATICANYIYDRLGITKALVGDITWDTAHVHCGDGVAISRRDRWVPSQAYVDKLTALADRSGIKYQIEIESDGGSDGGGIERSGRPIDWAFIGAPEKMPHSATESLDLDDLDAMGQLLSCLVDGLSRDDS